MLYKENNFEQNLVRHFYVTISQRDHEGVMVDHHWHDYYEILFVFDGCAQQTIDQEQFTISARDIVIIEPGKVHATDSISPSCRIIVIQYIPDKSLNLDARLYGGHLIYPYDYDAEIQTLFQKINDEYAAKLHGYESILHGCVYEFFGYLSRINSTPSKDEQLENEFSHVRLAFSYIDEHIHTPLHLKEVSAVAGYSPAYFSKLFKKTAGQSFKSYIDSTKMLKAKRLILFENRSVTETANFLGYEDTSSFCRTFKRVNGFPPSSLVARK